jgi:D-alanyl-D-alanine carboxypeptidase
MKVAAGCVCAALAALAVGCGSSGKDTSLGATCGDGTEESSPNVCLDPSDPKASQVAVLVEELRRRYKLNASIFGVWKGDDQLVTGAIGEALPGVAATRDLHFRICNVTESMTTTLLLQYVDEGKLSLDDPVSKWLPSVPRSEQITLGMVASSTTGIVDYVTTQSFVNELHKNPFRQFQPENLIEIATSQKPLFAPGTSWAFSDTNFVLLGELLKKAEGKPLGTQLREKILDPLGLDNTAMQPTAQVPFPTLHGYDPERGKYEDSTFWSPSWATNTGNMTSDLADLGKWTPVLGTGSLLSQKSHESQVGPGNVGLGGLTKNRYYGKGVGFADGWILTNPHCAGYNGVIAYFPPKKLSVVIFSTPAMGNSDGPNYSQFIFVETTKILTPESVPNLPQRVD